MKFAPVYLLRESELGIMILWQVWVVFSFDFRATPSITAMPKQECHCKLNPCHRLALRKTDPPVGTGGLYDKKMTKRQNPCSRSKLGGTDARAAEAVG